MDTPTDLKGALVQVATAIGLKAVERFTSQFDPDTMLSQATELVRTELKEAFREILADEDNPHASGLIDQLYQDLDAQDVIDRIADPLAKAFVDYFKQDAKDDLVEALVNAIIDQFDLDNLADIVAEKIAAKIQLGS